MKMLILGGVLLLLAPRPAAAKELEALRTQLGAADLEQAQEAAKELGASTDPKALDTILNALSVGAPPAVQGALLDALEGKKDARAIGVVSHYARNRNPELRKKAIVVVGALPPGDARAVPILLTALSDETPEVRAAAAEALGRRREHTAVNPLLELLERGDASAAPALAQLATPELARRISDQLGRVPDAQLCAVLGAMLERPDFGPDPVRVEVVRTLSKVPGADSTAALVEYLASSEKDKLRPSRTAAQKIVDQRSSQ
jgi:HEAT repeat protein